MVPPDKAPAVTTPTKNIQVPCGSLAVHWRGYTSCLPTEKGVPRGTAVARGRNDARLVTLPSAAPVLVTNWIEPSGLSNPAYTSTFPASPGLVSPAMTCRAWPTANECGCTATVTLRRRPQT